MRGTAGFSRQLKRAAQEVTVDTRKIAGRRHWVLVLAVLVSGCGLNRGGGVNPFAAPGAPGAQSFELIADNQMSQDVTVYYAAKGKRHRIGVVSAYTTTDLYVPVPSTGAIRFRVVPEEGLYDETGDVLVGTDNQVYLYVSSNGTGASVQVQVQ